jgi:uncharacterized membrane protein YebE (DUF533 family)
MIDAQSLLDRFLGQGMTAQAPSNQPQPGAPAGGAPAGQMDLAGVARQALSGAGGLGGLAASGVAGGLLGMLVGGKKKSKGGLGGVLSHGGAAMIGALASQAFQGWQKGQAPAQTPVAQPQQAVRVEQRFLPSAAPAADGRPFELAMVRAMIGAAKADGHVDAEEQDRIFARVGEVGLDPESKAFVFDALAAPVSVSEIAALATTPEQAAELYLVSRLAIDPDRPAELAYLQALAHRLKLPDDLVAHLDKQIEPL